jgi:hypothetical protein
LALADPHHFHSVEIEFSVSTFSQVTFFSLLQLSLSIALPKVLRSIGGFLVEAMAADMRKGIDYST